MSLERKQREKEKKLEERIQELEHQMYYGNNFPRFPRSFSHLGIGEEMKVKHEQTMSSQYALAKNKMEVPICFLVLYQLFALCSLFSQALEREKQDLDQKLRVTSEKAAEYDVCFFVLSFPPFTHFRYSQN